MKDSKEAIFVERAPQKSGFQSVVSTSTAILSRVTGPRSPAPREQAPLPVVSPTHSNSSQKSQQPMCDTAISAVSIVALFAPGTSIPLTNNEADR